MFFLSNQNKVPMAIGLISYYFYHILNYFYDFSDDIKTAINIHLNKVHYSRHRQSNLSTKTFSFNKVSPLIHIFIIPLQSML